MILIYCINGNLFWAHLASAEVSFSSFVFPQNKMIGKNWEGRNLFCMESLKNLSSFIWKALGRLIAAISYSTASHVRHTNPNTHETYKIKLQNSHNENFWLKHETELLEKAIWKLFWEVPNWIRTCQICTNPYWTLLNIFQ